MQISPQQGSTALRDYGASKWRQPCGALMLVNMPTMRINQVNENDTHFLTITVIEWIDIFTKPEYFQIIIDSLKFCRHKKGLLLYEYVIMTNHLHLIARAKGSYKLSQIISDFKKYTTTKIFKLLEQDNRKYIKNLIKNIYSRKYGYEKQVWQRENYPAVIASEKFFLEKVNYIHKNPVKKRFVAKAEDWLYSSARNRVLNDHSIIKLDDWN